MFEEHDRSLVARVQNYDLDVLFVRTNDVIEFVRDDVADLGVTGVDLLAETGAELPRIRSLGYGRCRLAAAVPTDSPHRARRGARRACVSRPPTRTSTRRFFEDRGISIEVIPISGAVEVAPRLGLAEAIVDLVSTGSTLVMNGLRPIGDVLTRRRSSSRTRPRTGSDRRARGDRHDALSSVIAARGRKYLMMNAPAGKLTELEALLPGLESPSVIPLAHEGMIAIHAVVEADEVWGLLPRLKAAGASGILALPIEKIVP